MTTKKYTLLDKPKTCFNCGNLYRLGDVTDVGILEIWSNGLYNSERTYCSKRCAETVLSNINSNQNAVESTIVIDKTEILSEKFPFKMRVYVKLVEPRITFEIRN